MQELLRKDEWLVNNPKKGGLELFFLWHHVVWMIRFMLINPLPLEGIDVVGSPKQKGCSG